METISTSTSGGPVFLGADGEGADGKIQIENGSKEKISREKIVCEIMSPDWISVNLGNAKIIEENKWRPVDDIHPMKRISMPIFINDHFNQNMNRGELKIKVEFGGQVREQSFLEVWV
jgi:hypothetical protein